MPYTPIYTTVDAIALRLRGRLLTAVSDSPFAPTVVDLDLVAQVAQQVEARINAKLNGRYQIPLRSSHPVLASIVEKLVICDLMATHFIADGNNEPGGFGRLMCSQGAAELEDILSGAVALTGEATKGGAVGAIASYTQVAQRRPGIAESIDWGRGTFRTQPIAPRYKPYPPVASGTGRQIQQAAFAYGDASPKIIYAISAGQTVFTAQIVIQTPFNGTGAALALGDGGMSDRLIDATQNDPTFAAEYETNPGRTYSFPDQILLTITPGEGCTQGSGYILLEV